jgi:hypothetical protein
MRAAAPSRISSTETCISLNDRGAVVVSLTNTVMAAAQTGAPGPSRAPGPAARARFRGGPSGFPSCQAERG